MAHSSAVRKAVITGLAVKPAVGGPANRRTAEQLVDIVEFLVHLEASWGVVGFRPVTFGPARSRQLSMMTCIDRASGMGSFATWWLHQAGCGFTATTSHRVYNDIGVVVFVIDRSAPINIKTFCTHPPRPPLFYTAQDRKKTPPTAQVGLARPRGLADFRDTRLLEINGLVQKVFATKSAFSSANPRTPASGRRSPDASLCVAVGLTNTARTPVSLA